MVKYEENGKNTKGVNRFQESTDIRKTKVKGTNWISDPGSLNYKRWLLKFHDKIINLISTIARLKVKGLGGMLL